MENKELSVLEINGKPFYFRDGTSDSIILSKTLETDPSKREYLFPQLPQDAKVILDIGANIGATALDLSFRYPSATVYAFEPEAKNFELLKMNTEWKENIKIFNFGLSYFNDTVNLYKSTDPINFGGFSTADNRGEVKSQVQIRSIKEVLTEQNIEQVDLIKIDCEGAENSIIFAIPQEILEKVLWIEGELHDKQAFLLLNYLQDYFDLAFKKPFNQNNWNFQALNRSLK